MTVGAGAALNSIKKHWKELIPLILFGSIFYSVFVLYSWSLWDIALEFPIAIGFALYMIMGIRLVIINCDLIDEYEFSRNGLPSWLPFGRFIIRLATYRRTFSKSWIVLENAEWLGLLAFAYIQWYAHFGFSYSSISWRTDFQIALWGEIAFLVASIIVPTVLLLSIWSLNLIYHDIKSAVSVFVKTCQVFIIYIACDIIFTLAYRFLYFVDQESFSRPLDGFQVAFYFSTITLSTLGYGDIYPQTSAARMLVCFETIFGLVLLAGILSVSISVAMSRSDPPPSR